MDKKAHMPGKRAKHRARKIKITVSVIVICIAALAAAFLLLKKQKPAESSAGYVSGSGDAELVSHNGKKYRYNDHLSNFVFMGVDKREMEETSAGFADAGQADAIFLLSWDRVEHTLRTVSIPRDTMTDIRIFSVTGRDLGKNKDHLSLAYAYGDGRNQSCELVRDAVSELLGGIPIQGYCSIDMDGIPVLADSVGGLEVVVPDSSLEEVEPEWTEGSRITLTGENTERFIRYRDITESQSALVRQERQKVFLQAYAEKAAGMAEKDASFVTKLYQSLEPYMITNMGNDIFAKIAADASEGGERETLTVPGEGTEGESYDEYHVKEEELYDMVISSFYRETE